ncbi:hypothetical protein CPC08DRAFT_720705 [Agrocybe pediades]|nr:hypothetical protein CPC08DRAFT_720705 [Agrocybe pediades]
MGTVPTTHRDGSELQPSHALRVAVYDWTKRRFRTCGRCIDWQTLSHLDLDERRRTIFFLERTGNWCSTSAEIWDTLREERIRLKETCTDECVRLVANLKIHINSEEIGRVREQDAVRLSGWNLLSAQLQGVSVFFCPAPLLKVCLGLAND